MIDWFDPIPGTLFGILPSGERAVLENGKWAVLSVVMKGTSPDSHAASLAVEDYATGIRIPNPRLQANAARLTGCTLEEYVQRRTTGEKWCTKCRKWLGRAEFCRDKSRRDGLATRCRFCVRAAYFKRKASR